MMYGHGQDAHTPTTWKPGTSGNPKGRPVGSRNKRMRLTPERVVMFFNQAETEDQIRVLGEETWRQALSGKNQRLFVWVTNQLFDAEEAEEAAGES